MSENLEQVVIIAGGLGTRLYPITKRVPKSMVKVGPKPFFEHQIELCRKNGIRNIVFCGGYLWEEVWKYFGRGRGFGVEIDYSIEEEILDTGGALKNAYPWLDREFFVLYGDSYLVFDWQEAYGFFTRSQAKGLMTVWEATNGFKPQVSIDERGFVKEFTKENFKPEMKYIEYGLNILKKNIIFEVPGEKFPIGDYFNLLIEKRSLVSFKVKNKFFEAGSFEGINELKRLIYPDDLS